MIRRNMNKGNVHRSIFVAGLSGEISDERVRVLTQSRNLLRLVFFERTIKLPNVKKLPSKCTHKKY